MKRLRAACIVVLLVVIPVRGLCSGLDHRYRQGFVGGRAPGCHRRSLQPGADRESPQRRR